MRLSQENSQLTLIWPTSPFSLPQYICTKIRLTAYLFFLLVTDAKNVKIKILKFLVQYKFLYSIS